MGVLWQDGVRWCGLALSVVALALAVAATIIGDSLRRTNVDLKVSQNVSLNGADVTDIHEIEAERLLGNVEPSQPQVTSVGALAADLDMNNKNLEGVRQLSAQKVYGQLTTRQQPYLTGLGVQTCDLNLGSNDLENVGSVSASTLTGILGTPSQPNVTSVGALQYNLDLNQNNLLNAGTITCDTIDGSLSATTRSTITQLGTLETDVTTSHGTVTGVYRTTSLHYSTVTLRQAAATSTQVIRFLYHSFGGFGSQYFSVVTDEDFTTINFHERMTLVVVIHYCEWDTTNATSYAWCDRSKTSFSDFTSGPGTILHREEYVAGAPTPLRTAYFVNNVEPADGMRLFVSDNGSPATITNTEWVVGLYRLA